MGPVEALHCGKHISISSYNNSMSDYTLAASILNIKMYALALIRHLTQNGPTILVGEPSNKQPGQNNTNIDLRITNLSKKALWKKAKVQRISGGNADKKRKTFPCILYFFKHKQFPFLIARRRPFWNHLGIQLNIVVKHTRRPSAFLRKYCRLQNSNTEWKTMLGVERSTLRCNTAMLNVCQLLDYIVRLEQ